MNAEDIIYPELGQVFLIALNYPEYARPEYYIKEQLKSDWSKGVFLRALLDWHEHYNMKLQIKSSHRKGQLKKEGRTLPEDFGLDLEEETKGKVEGKLTKKVLEDLRYAIQYAYKLNKEPPVFDSYQIISFCERILIFIKAQFNEQIKKTSSAKYTAERFRKEGQEVKGNPEYIIYTFNIISDAPVADFHRFRNEVRKLLLNSANPSELNSVLKPLYNISVEIVDLWNNKLQPIEVAQTEEERDRFVMDRRLITFDPYEMRIWHHNIYSPDDFYREQSEHFMNQDFAGFAAKVANLISGEVIKQSKVKKKVDPQVDEYDDLDELFSKPHYRKPCYEVLRDVGLIGENEGYIGNLKSAFCIWANELKIARLIKPVTDVVVTELMNRKFNGLKMDSSNFRTSLTKGSKLYKAEFKKVFTALSQPSQV